jgi:hypothetical protein
MLQTIVDGSVIFELWYSNDNYSNTITRKLLTSTIVCNMQSTSDNQEDAENEEDILDEEDEEDVAGEKENSEALECRVSREKVM